MWYISECHTAAIGLRCECIAVVYRITKVIWASESLRSSVFQLNLYAVQNTAATSNAIIGLSQLITGPMDKKLSVNNSIHKQYLNWCQPITTQLSPELFSREQFDDKSAFDLIMPWQCEATRFCLIKCKASTITTYDVTRKWRFMKQYFSLNCNIKIVLVIWMTAINSFFWLQTIYHLTEEFCIYLCEFCNMQWFGNSKNIKWR